MSGRSATDMARPPCPTGTLTRASTTRANGKGLGPTASRTAPSTRGSTIGGRSTGRAHSGTRMVQGGCYRKESDSLI